ncbi:hypothetical protein PPYR_02034 [Photinus pyralis]|uniref:Ubiquitin-like protease family profile domain-containing protein n=1 Tax=Photinus pyralis TaxID=7054 RepID=A0A5N4B684_PHOPY|nr:hypothetical protein PPYR_02034 [Photinus pyralis]
MPPKRKVFKGIVRQNKEKKELEGNKPKEYKPNDQNQLPGVQLDTKSLSQTKTQKRSAHSTIPNDIRPINSKLKDDVECKLSSPPQKKVHVSQSDVSIENRNAQNSNINDRTTKQKINILSNILIPNLQISTKNVNLKIPNTINDITSHYVHEQFYLLSSFDFLEAYNNPRSEINVNNLFGYLMYIAYITQNKRKVCLININYTVAIFNKTPTSPRDGAWGNPDTYEVLFVPIYFPRHFALIIHEKGGKTIFYDPLPEGNRLLNKNYADYFTRIKSAIREFDSSIISNNDIHVEIANTNTYNLQSVDKDDNYNCGYYVSLYVESYLMNDKHMLLTNLNIANERQRINRIIAELCHERVPIYEAIASCHKIQSSQSKKLGRKKKSKSNVEIFKNAKKDNLEKNVPPQKKICLNESMEINDNIMTLSQSMMPPPSSHHKVTANVEIANKIETEIFDALGDELMANLKITSTKNVDCPLNVPTNVAAITYPLPKEYYTLSRLDFIESYQNSKSEMNINNLHGYLMYVTYLAYNRTKSLLLNINYTVSIYNKITNVSPTEGLWGNPHNYEVLFIPIYFPGHFALIIHERGSKTIFYDPLPNDNRLKDNSNYFISIKNAIQVLDSSFLTNSEIHIEVANEQTYNLQTDSYNCGYYVCIYVETYLMNEKRMLLSDFNIATERQRINGMLLELYNEKIPSYETRSDCLFNEIEINDNEIVEICEGTPIESDSDVSIVSTSSSNSRRSTRSTRSTVSYSESRKSNKNKLKPMKYCKRTHGIYGCFAKSAKHSIDYLECGKIGDQICKHCKALLFKDETSAICCNHGTIMLPAISPVPEDIRKLMDDPVHGKHFRQYFRIYNMLLSFGSIEAGRKKAPGQGPPVMLINGEIKRNISPLFAPDGKTPVHGQLYMLDPMMMQDSVAQNPLSTKFGIKREILQKLFTILQKHHPLCEAFNIMHQLYMETSADVQRQGFDDVQHVTLVLVNPKQVPNAMIDPGLHPRAVNLPQVKELCAFYVSNENDEPVYRYGTWLKKKNGQVICFPLYDRLNDCLHYVLNLANGDFGYYPGIEKVKKRNTPNQRTITSAEQNDLGCSPNAVYDEEIDEVEHKNHVSVRDFYRFHLAIRGDNKGATHFLYPFGSITQEYIIDQSIKADQQVHEFIKKNYDTFCTTAPEVRMALDRDLQKLCEGKKLGKVLRLSSRMIALILYVESF